MPSQLLKAREQILSTDNAHILQFAGSVLGAKLESVIRGCIEGVPSLSWIEQDQHANQSSSEDREVLIDHEGQRSERLVYPDPEDETREMIRAAHENRSWRSGQHTDEFDHNNVSDNDGYTSKSESSLEKKEEGQSAGKMGKSPSLSQDMGDVTKTLPQSDLHNDDSEGKERRKEGHPAECYKCGAQDHSDRNCPLFLRLTCTACGREGHTSRDCTSHDPHLLPKSADAGPSIPKSILKRPTPKFPEDSDPIREGVAPHKNSIQVSNIPVDARWTKIDRRFVSPDALEAAKERFEERLDCVIVLRILTKEEITKLANRTREIREIREMDEGRSIRALFSSENELDEFEKTGASQTQRPTHRDMMFCPECHDEWYRDEHGLTCPECGSDFTEIIEETAEPRLSHQQRAIDHDHNQSRPQPRGRRLPDFNQSQDISSEDDNEHASDAAEKSSDVGIRKPHGGAFQRREYERTNSADDNNPRSSSKADENTTTQLHADSDRKRTGSLNTSRRRAVSYNDINEYYSYTDPASMYRDTEPAWRQSRAERPGRSSARDLGPPPSTRGFDKINNARVSAPRMYHVDPVLAQRQSLTDRTGRSSAHELSPSPSTRGHAKIYSGAPVYTFKHGSPWSTDVDTGPDYDDTLIVRRRERREMDEHGEPLPEASYFNARPWRNTFTPEEMGPELRRRKAI